MAILRNYEVQNSECVFIVKICKNEAVSVAVWARVKQLHSKIRCLYQNMSVQYSSRQNVTPVKVTLCEPLPTVLPVSDVCSWRRIRGSEIYLM